MDKSVQISNGKPLASPLNESETPSAAIDRFRVSCGERCQSASTPPPIIPLVSVDVKSPLARWFIPVPQNARKLIFRSGSKSHHQLVKSTVKSIVN